MNLPSSFVDSIWDNAPTEEPARQYYFIDIAKRYVKAMSEKLGRPLLCATKTFGCQMNARDSEKLLGILEKVGYVEGTDEETADLSSTTPVLSVRMQTFVSMAVSDSSAQ